MGGHYLGPAQSAQPFSSYGQKSVNPTMIFGRGPKTACSRDTMASYRTSLESPLPQESSHVTGLCVSTAVVALRRFENLENSRKKEIQTRFTRERLGFFGSNLDDCLRPCAAFTGVCLNMQRQQYLRSYGRSQKCTCSVIRLCRFFPMGPQPCTFFAPIATKVTSL